MNTLTVWSFGPSMMYKVSSNTSKVFPRVFLIGLFKESFRVAGCVIVLVLSVLLPLLSAVVFVFVVRDFEPFVFLSPVQSCRYYFCRHLAKCLRNRQIQDCYSWIWMCSMGLVNSFFDCHQVNGGTCSLSLF